MQPGQKARTMPENVNLIFGRNLRQLCEERGTFSEAARVLDVSRVQLSRYFKGESFPKPNQLDRICALFGVDARIYTQPLSELAPLSADREPLTGPDAAFDSSSLVPGFERYMTGDIPVSNGLHLLYRPSFSLPGHFIVAPLLVRSTNRGTVVRTLDMAPIGLSRREAGPPGKRGIRGLALATPDGLVMHLYGTGEIAFLATAHFSSESYFTATGTFRGTYELYRSPHAREYRRVPILLQAIQQKPEFVLPAMRRTGIVQLSAIPERFHEYLTTSVAA